MTEQRVIRKSSLKRMVDNKYTLGMICVEAGIGIAAVRSLLKKHGLKTASQVSWLDPPDDKRPAEVVRFDVPGHCGLEIPRDRVNIYLAYRDAKVTGSSAEDHKSSRKTIRCPICGGKIQTNGCIACNASKIAQNGPDFGD